MEPRPRGPTLVLVVETPLHIARVWVEFDDPATPGQRFRCDLTWLTSNWRCTFGGGCAGIYADRPHDGCCTLGAHFTDDDDVERVAAAVDALTPRDWQRHPGKASDRTVWLEYDADGSRKTRVVDGGCVFLNQPGFTGGAGCALHAAAIRSGAEPHRLKPDVCWQLPTRRSYRTVELPDGTSYLEVSITEYDRRAWGAGGHDLDWYCSSNPAAHTAREPVFRSCRVELIELMGQAAYEELAVRCDAHLRLVRPSSEAGRALRRLYLHPATAEAAAAPTRKPATTREPKSSGDSRT